MHLTQTPIPIRPANAADGAGCGGCGGGDGGAACQRSLGRPCASPVLSGPSDLLRLAMDSLRRVLDPEGGRNLVELQLVQSLRVDGDEAELTVTFPRGCGSARVLAEGAFQSLRGVLPDTDIYVRHAA